jgi:hypothetical protein
MGLKMCLTFHKSHQYCTTPCLPDCFKRRLTYGEHKKEESQVKAGNERNITELYVTTMREKSASSCKAHNLWRHVSVK